MAKLVEPLFYLASPFTHKLAKVRKARVEAATSAAIALLKYSVHVFSPIAYNGNWERRDLPGDWAFWGKYDLNFLARCTGIIVLTIDGWDKSTGVLAEIKFSEDNGQPVYYVSEKDLASPKAFLKWYNKNLRNA